MKTPVQGEAGKDAGFPDLTHQSVTTWEAHVRFCIYQSTNRVTPSSNVTRGSHPSTERARPISAQVAITSAACSG